MDYRTKNLSNLFKKSALNQTAKDLVRKNYLPENFGQRLLNDPSLQAQSLMNYGKDLFGEYQCPHCQILIKCPKEWIKFHIKTHFKPDSKKENEIQQAVLHPYY